MRPNGRQPLVLTEFGGYSCALADHRFNPDEEYGYQKYATAVEFQRALSKLYRNDILPQIPNGLCGTILTQVSDVEDETNGLVTYDRMVIKADREEMQKIADGKATKIIIPSEMQGLVGLANGIVEGTKE